MSAHLYALPAVPAPTGSAPAAQRPAERPKLAAVVPAPAVNPGVSVEVFPSTPPPEALAEVDIAAEVVGELAELKRELHFAKDKNSGRIIVEVRDFDGNVLRTIPPGEAMDILAGGPLE